LIVHRISPLLVFFANKEYSISEKYLSPGFRNSVQTIFSFVGVFTNKEYNISEKYSPARF